MHLTRLSIRNIRSIEAFDLELEPDEAAGWHVILGDNGAGKTSIIRSIALVLIGSMDAPALRQNWRNWVRNGVATAEITAQIVGHPACDKGNLPFLLRPSSNPFQIGLTITPDSGKLYEVEPSKSSSDYSNYVLGPPHGWFSASFGPFRRFAGGDASYENMFASSPRAAAHLSAFGEDVALTEALRWIQQLHIKRLEKDELSARKLHAVTEFLNRAELLPHGAQITEVSSSRVLVRNAEGMQVPIDQMSDGYRSILSLTFELLRQMFFAYEPDYVFANIDTAAGTINVPGIVCIDEVDAHLHPSWQKRIGPWFTEHFPRLQFFVTTHSPIICQAAAKGSIWALPAPGSSEPARRIRGAELDKLIYGSILDAYGTQLFGVGVARSDASSEKLQELALLNRDSLERELTPQEREKLEGLRAMLTSSSSKTVD